MRIVISVSLLGALLAAPLAAQQMRPFFQLPEAPAVTPTPSDGGTILWDQSAAGNGFGFVDQAFTDFPTYDTFEVNDVTTGGAVWNVNKITQVYSKGAGGGGTLDLWDPLTITTGHLNVFPDTGALPSDATDIPPEITIPITLTDIGGAWALTADTSGVAELQCISGDFWVGVTPITEFLVHDQEFRLLTTPTVGDDTAMRNPGGGFLLGTTWMSISVFDPGGTAGPPYEANILLEGDVLTETWTTHAGTGVSSPFWASVPVVFGSGIACVGQSISLTGFENGVTGDLTNLVIGPALFAPFKGGTLVPDVALIILIPVGAFGDFFVAGPWPPGIPPGFSFYFQTWTNELGGALGWSASDGLEVVSQ